MADIPIKTLTENCWLRCPNFEVEKHDTIFANGSVVNRILECENFKMCRHAVDEAKKEIEEVRNGDSIEFS